MRLDDVTTELFCCTIGHRADRDITDADWEFFDAHIPEMEIWEEVYGD